MDPEVAKRLDALGEKLGVTVEYLWGAAVRFTQAQGWAYSAAFVALIVVCVVVALKAIPRAGRAFREDDVVQIPLTFLSIGALGGGIAGLFGIVSNLTAALAPEGATLLRLLGKS